MEHAATKAPLSRFVEDVREIVPVVGRDLQVDWLPNGRATLVFRVTEVGRSGDVAVAGPRTRALFKRPTGVSRAMLFQLKPGWSPTLLGVSANTLTAHIIPLEDVWGPSGLRLSAALLAAATPAEALDRLADTLTARAREGSESASARLVRHAVRLLEGAEVRVESVAKRLGVTSRHLRRAFKESIGVGPKDFARSVRLQRAVRIAATSKDWGRIAADAGYYDQAHLNAEFRELIGLTPGAFLKRAASTTTSTAPPDAR